MASTSYHKTILTAGGYQKEAMTVAAITPAMLGELDANGKIKPHATANGDVAPIIVCLENELDGGDIEDAYAVGEQAQYQIPASGQEVVLRIANGETVAKMGLLVSNGDGYMKAEGGDSSAVEGAPRRLVARALEAKDMSDSSAADPNCKCRCVIV